MGKTFGISIGLGIVKPNFEKPFEENFEKAFSAFKEYKKAKISERKAFFGVLSRKDWESLVGIKLIENSSIEGKKFLEGEYKKILFFDEERLFLETVELNREMENNLFLLKKKRSFAKSIAKGIFRVKNAFSGFERLFKKKILLEMGFFRLLPFCYSLIEELPESKKQFVKYNESDAIEFVSKPGQSLNKIEKELLRNILLAEKILAKKGLKLFFGSVYPKTKRMGLLKKIGIGEDQNFLELHLHMGNFDSAAEMAELYNKIIGFFEANPLLIEEERRLFYGLKNPRRLSLKGIEEQIRARFGKNSRLEKPGRPDIDAIISALNNRKQKFLARDYATVFIRPELGTIEIRAFGTKGNGTKSIRKNLHENIVFFEQFMKKLELASA
ncbi:MAG: hypothetical protein PHD95_00395 [Candidatus ainarchaeum sp.]|nr:hypothetical protein [Candidatus ainarchaeum sp.]